MPSYDARKAGTDGEVLPSEAAASSLSASAERRHSWISGMHVLFISGSAKHSPFPTYARVSAETTW